MVTLITEKLKNQSLDDLSCKACEAGPCSAENLSRRDGHWSPLEVSGDESPWKASHTGRPACPLPPGPHGGAHTEGLQWRPESPDPCTGLGVGSTLNLCGNTGPPAAPPTKRHCRSLSEPEELARCQSPWRPGGSKVWTPVSKRRCNSGGSTALQWSPGAGLRRSPVSPAGPTSPLVPRPASASSGFVDSSEGSSGSGVLWRPAGPCLLSSRRRLSLSQEHLTDAGNPTSRPELGWHHGLPRCRSQPCVLGGRRSRRKRRREEDPRWTRPSLDLLKMTRTLKNSKSLCSLDCDDDDEDETQAKTVVSSPCGSQGLSTSMSPRVPGLCPTSSWASREPVAGTDEGGSSGDPSDWDSAGEEGIFPLDHGDLDLEQIENN